MATRREFLRNTAGIAAALSGANAVSGAAKARETAPGERQRSSAASEGTRRPFRLHLIGCGYPPPAGTGDRTRHGSAFLLQVGKEYLMVDCGPGTTYKMSRMGISTKTVNHIFLTHHHFDHNVDVPCFALVRWDLCNGKETPLKIDGPPPTRAFVEQLFGENGAFFPDWHSRVTHPTSVSLFEMRGGVSPRPGPRFEVRDLEPGKVEQTDSWTVTAAKVHHVEPTLISLAYRFNTDQGDIVFAGDCGDCPELRELTQGADTLVTSCVTVGSASPPSYLRGIVMGTDDVRSIAKNAGVRRVVLTHNGGANTPKKKKPFIDAIGEVFSGEVQFPDELTTLDLLG